MKTVVLISAMFLVTACISTSEVVHMKNSKTGEIAKCGPYTGWGSHRLFLVAEEQASADLRHCVEDYQKAGYVRVGD